MASQHRHERHDPGTASDEQYRLRIQRIPDEPPANRAPQFNRVADRVVVYKGSHAVVDGAGCDDLGNLRSRLLVKDVQVGGLP